MDEQIKQMEYLNNEILFNHKKEGNAVNCNNMDGPGGHYAM